MSFCAASVRGLGNTFAVLEERTMRWIILALSLGTFILSVGYSMLVLFGYITVSSGAMPLWLVVTLTIASAVFAMIGGIAAFKYHRTGSVY